MKCFSYIDSGISDTEHALSVRVLDAFLGGKRIYIINREGIFSKFTAEF